MGDSNQVSIRRRLARLGKARPSRGEITISRPPSGQRAGGRKGVLSFGLDQAVERETAAGIASVLEKTVSLESDHGLTRLGDINQVAPLIDDALKGPGSGEGLPVERLVFLDTETTGLAGGAGTLAFLVGAGYIRKDQFTLRQYFLRSPGEEAAMLSALAEDLGDEPVFVTYNGTTFDLPLLETRALVGLRQRWKLSGYPHLDLLHFARRMWRQVLPDCRLSTVELHVLGVKRAEEDIPGAEIPDIYRQYLHTGDTSGIDRVLYHNEVDILSLLTLLVQLVRRFMEDDYTRLEGPEVLALGRWHEGAGRKAPAEEAYRQAMESDCTGVRVEALKRLSLQLKRDGRYEQALVYWMQWQEIDPTDPMPRVEMAKYFEWHARDLDQARHWAGEAMVCLTHWVAGPRRARVWGELEHRQKRLAEKIERHSGTM